MCSPPGDDPMASGETANRGVVGLRAFRSGSGQGVRSLRHGSAWCPLPRIVVRTQKRQQPAPPSRNTGPYGQDVKPKVSGNPYGNGSKQASNPYGGMLHESWSGLSTRDIFGCVIIPRACSYSRGGALPLD